MGNDNRGDIFIPNRQILRAPGGIARPHGAEPVVKIAVKKGFVLNGQGLAVPVKEEGELTVVIPDEKDIEKYTALEKAKTKTSNQEQLFYVSSPWNFFDKKLTDAGISSPIEEIQKTEGPIDAAFLNYNDWENFEKNGSIPPQFYDFLDDSVRFISEFSNEASEMDKFFSYLNVLVESQIYSNRCYKLDSPEHVEKMLETLIQNNILLSPKMCDFFSYFNLSESQKKDLLGIIPKNFKHPLRAFLVNSLEKDDDSDATSENIGIEIEGIPMISLGQFSHPGFKMGMDGGATMPELRRVVEGIKYDQEFKQDLFHLWYWAKMSRLAGASVHIHIDDDGDPNTMEVFKRTFGYTSQDINSNNPSGKQETIEIRLNLPYYEYFLSKDASKRPAPDPGIYSLNGLIEEIIRLKEGAKEVIFSPDGYVVVGDNQLGESLHPFWKARFIDKSIRIDTVNELIERTKGDINEIVRIVAKLPTEALSIDLINSLIEKSGKDYYVIRRIMGRLPNERFSIELINNIIEKTGNNSDVIQEIVEKLPTEMVSINFMNGLMEKSGYNHYVIEQVIGKMPSEMLSVDLANSLIEKSGNNYDVIEMVISKLSLENFSADLVDSLIEKSGVSRSIIRSVINKISPESFSAEFINSLSEKFGNDHSIIRAIVDRIAPIGGLSGDMIINLVERSGNDFAVIEEITERMALLEVSDDIILALVERSGNDLDVIDSITNELVPERLWSVMDSLIERSKNSNSIIQNVIERLPSEKFSVDLMNSLIDKSGGDSDVIRTAVKKLALGELSETLIDSLVGRSGNDYGVIWAVLEKLPPERFSTDLINNIIERSEGGFAVIELVIKRLTPTELSDDIINNLIEKSRNNDSIIQLIVEKIFPQKYSRKLFDSLIKKSGNDRDVIRAAVNNMPAEELSVGLANRLIKRSIPTARGVIRAVAGKLALEKFSSDLVTNLIKMSQNDVGVIKTLVSRFDLTDTSEARQNAVTAIKKINRLTDRVLAYDNIWGKIF